MKQFSLTVTPREGVGRGASRRVRKSGRVPAVIYGRHIQPRSLSIDGPEFTRLLKSIAGSAAVVELNDGGAEPRLSIIQEVQRDPITDRILHIDLHEVQANEEIELSVTVHTVGDSVGVRTENGILELVVHEVRIRCLPRNLPRFIEVDVTELKLNQSIHVSELPKIPGVKYVDEPGRPVIACVEPVVEVEPTPAEAAAVPVEGEAAAAAPGTEGAAPAAAGTTPAAAPAAGAKGAAAPVAKGAAAPAAKGAAAPAGKGAEAKPADKKGSEKK